MGKDQRNKKHGLDVRRNARQKAELEKLKQIDLSKLTVDTRYQRDPAQYRSQR